MYKSKAAYIISDVMVEPYRSYALTVPDLLDLNFLPMQLWL